MVERKMRNVWLICIAALAALAVLTSVARYGPVGENRAARTDPQGGRQRIASLAPNLTEILFALGLGDSVVAVSSDSDYPPAARTRKKLGSFWQPNVEATASAQPDLVVTLAFAQQQAAAESLSRLGIEVLTVQIDTVAELFDAIETIGQATGRPEPARRLVAQLDGKLKQISSRFTATARPKVLWVVQTEPLRVASRRTFANELIELAGGQNAIGPTISRYPEIGSEQVLASGAEVIIQPAMGKASLSRQQQDAERFWRRWPELPAVKNRRIYVLDADALVRLSPRLPEAVETVAQCLHPALPSLQGGSKATTVHGDG